MEKSHSLMVRSEDADARCDPVGVKDRECTVLVCPFRVRTYSPLSWSHTCGVDDERWLEERHVHEWRM